MPRGRAQWGGSGPTLLQRVRPRRRCGRSSERRSTEYCGCRRLLPRDLLLRIWLSIPSIRAARAGHFSCDACGWECLDARPVSPNHKDHEQQSQAPSTNHNTHNVSAIGSQTLVIRPLKAQPSALILLLRPAAAQNRPQILVTSIISKVKKIIFRKPDQGPFKNCR